ncbi:hypothetical protein O181_121184 [Austropuccinia psidii MF-1]|uniref:Uncharacterized protein n=1 Tax=Austropuccinia psidii MF-1 TaxID=1389203 RepID=A0A9Q3KKL3_9BASI|nr:hypothetical protein [Austropuccinia psidii MF-1]
MPKSLAGGHELLLTHQELSGSGEDHNTLRRLEPIVLQRQGQKAKELVEGPNSFIHRPEERVRSDSSFGDRGPSGIYQLQASPEVSKDKPKRPQKKQRGSKNHQGKEKAKTIHTDLTHKGTGSPNWSLQPWTVYSTWTEL